MPIPDNSREEKNQTDYSFLLNLSPSSAPKKMQAQASNRDASLLFEIWASSSSGNKEDIIVVSEDMGISSREIMRLKTMGFLTGTSKEVKFTNRGKAVITTMALGETNKFMSKKQEKSYTEILASMSKRGKPGFRSAQYSINNENSLNLKNIK